MTLLGGGGGGGVARRFWERTILLHGELMQTACIVACECTAIASEYPHPRAVAVCVDVLLSACVVGAAAITCGRSHSSY
eukprot:COSAG01_NODE_1000_length_12213_cov_20.853063_9_plen_79_part_00